MNIVQLKVNQQRLKGEAYHRLAEALDRLAEFYHLYAEYLMRMADVDELILKEKGERRRT